MFLVNSVWTQQTQPQSDYKDSMRDMMFDDFEIAMKVVIVGNGSVGKSSMIQRFCRGIFTRDYKKTIGVDFLERVMTIDDQSVRLMLWDTAGQEEFDAITRTYYRGANACVLACSVTDKDSFLALPKWKNKVCRECGDIPMVLVVNKIDLQKQAVVDSAEIEGMARSLGIPKLFRTSVKEDLNVNCVFTFLSTAYVQSVLSQSALEDEEHIDTIEEPEDLPLNHRLNSPLFGGKNNKSGSNNKGKIPNNGLAILPSNKVKSGRNLFRNPVILKSSSANNNTNSNSTSNHRGFFSSNKKQNNNIQPQHHQHFNIFRSPPTKAALFASNGVNGTHRNGQIIPQSYRPNAYSPYVNGGGGVAISMDPNRWSDTNVPFRLDLVNGKKRRRDSCSIL